MPKVVVYLGPARSGKTHELLQHYRDALGKTLAPREVRLSRSEKLALDRVLWLAPNGRTAALVRSQLVAGGLDACLRPGIVTFHQLTDLILTDTPERLRRLPPVAQRELLRRVINDALAANELALLAEAARRSGFILLLAEHIGELKRRGVSPAAYAKARPPRGDVRQHHELALLFSQYERQLTTHGLCDAETAHSTARDALATGGSKRFQNLELVVVDGFTDFTPTQHDLLRLLAQRTKQLLIALPHDSTESAPVRTGRFSD
ncbi:MAG: UvrD-helicase domain-containing protein, partial [Pirellulales bacterium]